MTKTFAGLLALSLLCLPQSAFCGDPATALRELVKGVTGPSREDLVKSILVCSRDLVGARIGGSDGVLLAGSFIEAAGKSAGDREALATIDALCKSSAQAGQKSGISRDQQGTAARFAGIGCPARSMLENFIKPAVTCKKGGIAVSAAVAIGVGLKVDVAKCSATDGHSWLELSLGGAIGGGVGAEADLNFGTISQGRNGYSRSPISVNGTSYAAGGVGIVIKGEDKKLPDGFLEAPVKGVGLGAGGTILQGGQLNIELIPLGTDRNAIYDRFQKLQNGSCDEYSSAELKVRAPGSENGDAVAIAQQAEQDGAKTVTAGTGGSAPDTGGSAGAPGLAQSIN